MGVAVLMQRGELPADAFDVLTRRDVVLATPLPPALEYFAGARYSALEVKGGDAWPDDDGADAWLSDLREGLVINANSDEWLRAFDAQALAEAISDARRTGHDEAPVASSEVVVAATPPPAGTLADRPSAGPPAGAPLAPASAAGAAREALPACPPSGAASARAAPPLPLPPADPAPARVATADATAAGDASGRIPATGAAGADTARDALRAARSWNSFNFASGIGPSTRPCHPRFPCCLTCVLQNTSHPGTGALLHCSPRPSAQIRAKHLVRSIVSGVKRRQPSGSASDGPARGSTLAGAWSAAAAPVPPLALEMQQAGIGAEGRHSNVVHTTPQAQRKGHNGAHYVIGLFNIWRV